MKTALFILAFTLSPLSLQAAADVQPAALKNVGVTQRLNERIPLDLKFRNESGQIVPLSTYFSDHKPVLLTLVYYQCPMLCSEILNGVLRTLRALPLNVGKDFNVVTVSFDPTEMPPLAAQKKANYLDKYNRAGSENGWAFLTGEESSVRALAQAVGFQYEWDPQIKQFAHGSAIMVVTPQGLLSRYFYGVEYPTQDVRLSLVEAGQGKVGSFIDQVMLYCYQYNPATGRYGLVIMRAVQIAGALTALALALFVGLMLWHEKKNHRMKEKNV